MSWILSLYEAYHIPYLTEGDRHCRPGWANVPCPFCTGNPGPHLGVYIESGNFNCWRCGAHPTSKVIAALVGVSEQQARGLIAQYSKNKKPIIRRHTNTNHKVVIHRFKHPPDTHELDKLHTRYLEKRKFDPEKLSAEWGLLGTGPAAHLDDIDYRFRILAPIYWDGKEVTFQTRDCTGKSMSKYLACPKNRETIHHKDIVYGQQKKWLDVGICVEGITDVWRLGPAAFATFGIEVSTIKHIADGPFRRLIILFDSERIAQKRAKVLQAKIRARSNMSVHIERLREGDPADMSQDDADHLVRQLTRTFL